MNVLREKCSRQRAIFEEEKDLIGIKQDNHIKKKGIDKKEREEKVLDTGLGGGR